METRAVQHLTSDGLASSVTNCDSASEQHPHISTALQFNLIKCRKVVQQNLQRRVMDLTELMGLQADEHNGVLSLA